VTVEVAVRVLEIGPQFQAAPRERFQLSENAILEYELAPGYDDGSVPISSAGLRDREYSKVKPAGVFRIAAIGDSVTCAFGVDPKKTYPKQLEELLNLYAPPGSLRYEVMNFGVTGYNSRQSAEMVKSRALAYSPDLIVYAYVLNDPESSRLKEELSLERSGSEGGFLVGLERKSAWLLSQSRLLLLLKAIGSQPASLHPDDFKNEYEGTENDEDSKDLRGDHASYLRTIHNDPDSWARVSDAILRIAEAARRPPATPTLVAVFPTAAPLGYDAYPFGDLHDRVIQEADRNGLYTLDLRPAFQIIQETLGDKFHDDYIHPNHMGYLAAALAIMKRLGELQLFGEGTRPFDVLLRNADPGSPEAHLASLFAREPGDGS
jgi:hypothetical protein